MKNRFVDKTASLVPMARQVICSQATEPPHSGHYNTVMIRGTYLCRRCGLALFRAQSQFNAGCGWPSFDDEIEHSVKQIPDADGLRTEIRCYRCNGHLGHLFDGEYMTSKNRRHCVNSHALDFVHDNAVLDSEEAILAGGCFWGVDYYLRRLPGILAVEVGYCGGHLSYPTYDDVCRGNTGHYEVVRVVFDHAKTNYTAVLKRFFEIHDPTQSAGQGPDQGSQYQSAVFYFNENQKTQANNLIITLKKKGYEVATQLLSAQIFWPAETYHQDYYGKSGHTPHCHHPIARFD